MPLAAVGEHGPGCLAREPLRTVHLRPLVIAAAARQIAQQQERDLLEDALAVGPLADVPVLDIPELLHELRSEPCLLAHRPDGGVRTLLARLDVTLRQRV